MEYTHIPLLFIFHSILLFIVRNVNENYDEEIANVNEDEDDTYLITSWLILVRNTSLQEPTISFRSSSQNPHYCKYRNKPVPDLNRLQNQLRRQLDPTNSVPSPLPSLSSEDKSTTTSPATATLSKGTGKHDCDENKIERIWDYVENVIIVEEKYDIVPLLIAQ
ncbi:hypothetical protein P9112_010004 [Eukaryota sp. TZLM1-RC]